MPIEQHDILSKYRPFNTEQPVTDPPPMATLQQVLSQRGNPQAILDPAIRRANHDQFKGLSPAMIEQEKHAQAVAEAQRKAQEKTLSLSDLTLYRVRVGYRIVREIGRHLGIGLDDEPVLEATMPSHDGASAWETPRAWTPDVPKTNRITRPSTTITHALSEAYAYAAANPQDCPWEEILVEDTTTKEQVKTPRFLPGIALLPPDPPRRWIDRTTGKVLPNYDPANPEHDPMLHRYIAVIEATARHMGLRVGSDDEPHMGTYGLTGLIGADAPWLIRACFPTPAMLLAWESELIDTTIESLAESNLVKVRRLMLQKHGLLEHEREALLKMARRRAVAMSETTLEEDKAMMVLQVEAATQRARDRFDLRGEMYGLKLLALIKGLGKVDPTDAVGEFVKVVDAVSRERRLTEQSMPQLPEEIE